MRVTKMGFSASLFLRGVLVLCAVCGFLCMNACTRFLLWSMHASFRACMHLSETQGGSFSLCFPVFSECMHALHARCLGGRLGLYSVAGPDSYKTFQEKIRLKKCIYLTFWSPAAATTIQRTPSLRREKSFYFEDILKDSNVSKVV